MKDDAQVFLDDAANAKALDVALDLLREAATYECYVCSCDIAAEDALRKIAVILNCSRERLNRPL